MSRHRQGHVSGWGAALLAPIAIPLASAVVLAERLFGLKTTANLRPLDVERYLTDFLDGSGGEWDWDDFTSIPISDPTVSGEKRRLSRCH
ncbi:MAG: hypothetical protein K2P79_08615 [Sphingomonas sp.]|nr:hypothetical protein [Sphingomonas sp.]